MTLVKGRTEKDHNLLAALKHIPIFRPLITES